MYTEVANKMTYANSADPEQAAPEGAVWSGLHCLSTKNFKKLLYKKQNLGKKGME